MAEYKIETPANKQMNVIWHEYVASEANSPDFTLVSKTNQCVMHASICKKFLAAIRVESHKVQRWIVSLK